MSVPALVVAALVLLGSPAAWAQARAGDCDNCGRVLSVRQVSTEATAWRPLGSVTAGTVGDDLAQPGRTSTALQFSKGEKPTVVALGASGGVAYAKRPQAYQRPRWDIAVRMDAGDTRTIQTDYDPLVDEGDRVRVYGTQLERIAQP